MFDYEIIVVDNASGDGSLELIQKQYPEVICVQADETWDLDVRIIWA